MKTEEEAPAGKLKASTVQNRTTEHTTTARAFTHGHRLATAPSHRRWRHRPRFTISDAAIWALFTLVVGTVLIAGCVLLTLGAPS